MDKIIKEFFNFSIPPSISKERQLENEILNKIRLFGYYPLDDETIEIIKKFSEHLIKRLNALKK